MTVNTVFHSDVGHAAFFRKLEKIVQILNQSRRYFTMDTAMMQHLQPGITQTPLDDQGKMLCSFLIVICRRA